ncbi:unnamed protein product [Anisakis simplex]|uniref:PK_Tyr_Ser-Thr domain-containing protein n=1 Tax=Anisakis simplex TaxID=6269 RepID=A0A0M3J465_ANISI|nr:unnamed protein product [Anisakis simplex]
MPMDPPPGSPPRVMAVMILCFIQDAADRPEFSDVLRILSPRENIATPAA